MNEFYEYDTMIARHSTNLSHGTLPLISWEFYAEDLTLVESHKEDFNALKKITKDWSFYRDYHKELIAKKSVILITNPNLTIVYASQNMIKMNGYSNEEVVGNSPKMFQGEDTCPKMSKKIRNAVDRQIPFEASLLNYRKDNSTYMCEIKGFPVHDKNGKLIHYIAFEKVA
ncbi:PAS domain-containing protein [Aquimarina pacifica]|uniref:PAS domain-containing protein n=1 Tax=Aquimarina pacifica TaxID=1296415 RepID=UPI00046F748F|nr:PAS domain-containing protein [Aquimarina pacifica]